VCALQQRVLYYVGRVGASCIRADVSLARQAKLSSSHVLNSNRACTTHVNERQGQAQADQLADEKVGGVES
jgi:hypothetical protein